MWQILPNLFLGNRDDSQTRPRLQQHAITHIVNCSQELPCLFEPDISYLWLKMTDPDHSFHTQIPHFCVFIDRARTTGNVLVHCTAGVSRSPAVILAYLCHVDGSLHKAVDRLSKAVLTGIDDDFLLQLARHRQEKISQTELRLLQEVLLGRRHFKTPP